MGGVGIFVKIYTCVFSARSSSYSLILFTWTPRETPFSLKSQRLIQAI